MITGKFKDADYRNGIRRLDTLLKGRGLASIVKEEAILFFKELLRVIPPKTQAQGRRAVKRDLTRAVELLEPKAFSSARMKTLIRKRDYAAVRQIFKHVPGRENWRVEPFAKSFHESARGSRGRVHTPRKVATLDGPQWRRYLRELQARVGYLKGQFAFPLANLGAPVPKWLRRHFSSYTGRFRNHLRKPGNPHVKATIDLFDVGRFTPAIDFALNRRIRAMARKADRLAKEAWGR